VGEGDGDGGADGDVGLPDGEGDTDGDGVTDGDGEGVGDAVGTGVGDGVGEGVGTGLSNPAWPKRSAATKIRPKTATMSATQIRETGSSTTIGSSGCVRVAWLAGRDVLGAGSVIRRDYEGARPLASHCRS
jgi:hypothetical protein